MDALSDICIVRYLTGRVFLNAEFTASWRMAAAQHPDMSASPRASVPFRSFDYVVEGSLSSGSRKKGGPPSRKEKAVVLPSRNDLHRMGRRPRSSAGYGRQLSSRPSTAGRTRCGTARWPIWAAMTPMPVVRGVQR